MTNFADEIDNIIQNQGNCVVVLKGFDKNIMPKELKYFSFEIDYYDIVDIETLNEKVIDEIIVNRTFKKPYLWMTIEEYQLFKEHSQISKMPIIAIENNLYDKQFPYQNTISDIDNIYHYLYYQEDNELDEESKKSLERVSVFYGKIDLSKESNSYYVTYPEFNEDINVYKIFDEKDYNVEISDTHPVENLIQIELSDDEMPFLELTQNIEKYKNKKHILFILSGSVEDLPNNYLHRLSILNNISGVSFYFTTLSIRRKVIDNEGDYKKILKNVYGYEHFRDIKFYKNIESRSKETIEISQLQIIDDIVIQAEKAMHGDDFRDIYITASTGSGKSVMFQIPALYLSEKYNDDKPLTLVISPLIGLMNDQVDSMKRKGINNSATINGSTSPYEKEQIIEQIKEQKVDVLYLSPETLQARSDIKMLIGERNISVVIVDEAHIVTTWGKSFRADYWYLGIYLAKLRKEYRFPIVTFTATSIYGGREDMYLDTRNSLNMISPISYFGDVRRDNILMNVQSSEKDLDNDGRDYRKTKDTLALKHLIQATKKKEKSLVYFPTVKLLQNFYSFVLQNEPTIAEKTGKYFGTLSKEEKDEVLNEYKNGELQFVLATKAFGMGIDIPDITNVYHYAPTGNVVDYIQEIGRAARDKELVPYGVGRIDFLKKDMNEVKQLHGMSSIKKSQIIEVMRKVLSIYKEKGNNRNIILSPEDFKYIFVENKRDEDSLDNKVKTVLLMIEKDFSSPNKLGYPPFVARPRSLYGNDLLFVTSELEEMFINSRLGKYFTKIYNISSKTYTAIYEVKLSEIWETYYNNMSYPSFKHSLFIAEERENFKHKKLFEKFIYCSGIEVTLSNNLTTEQITSQYKLILKAFTAFVDQQRILNRQFTVEDLGNRLMESLKIADKFEARAFAQAIINAAFEFGKIKEIKFISISTSSLEVQKYTVHQDGDIFTTFIINAINNVLNPKDNYVTLDDVITSYCFRSRSDEIDSKIAALGIGESRKLLTYQLIGGSNPQIYLRMNSIYPLEKSIKQGDFYKNSILTEVQTKHYTSVEMLNYLFTKEQPEKKAQERILNYSKWFWDNIENYFMGTLPNDVEERLSRKQ